MNKRQENLKNEVKQKSKDFASLFSTPEGKKILKLLQEEFILRDFRGVRDSKTSVEDTYFNLGRRDVIVYIEDMIKYSERTDD